MVHVACIQLNSSDNMEANLASATKWIREAAKSGAKWVTTPENTVLMTDPTVPFSGKRFLPHEHPALPHFSNLAHQLGIWLSIGSIAVALPNQDKLANRSFLFDPHGQLCAHYDKIHLFDVSLPGGETYRESSRCLAGDKTVVAELPWGNAGFTICYDVRFPHLYRTLAKKGAHFITVPAAFTRTTGEAHWHVLLRARAIETGSYIIASAQTGTHPGGRETYGHSLIVTPWGEILADGGIEEGFISAEIEKETVENIRTSLPSLMHDRPFA